MTPTPGTAAVPATLPAGDWRVVPDRSELGFTTRVMFGLLPMRGGFSGCDGQLHVDGAGNATGAVRVEAATISSGIKRRDKHLRTSDFFSAEEHTHLSFELTSLTPDEAAGQLTATGTLQIRDQMTSIRTPVSVSNTGSDSARVDAEFEVDPNAFGFEFKWLPRTARVHAGLVLERVS